MLNQGHLKEQSVHRRQMETISSPLENSQSSKEHICFYFPRHRLWEDCSWCAYGKIQLHEEHQDFAVDEFVATPSDTDSRRHSVPLDLNCLDSFAKPSYRFMEKQAIWLVIKQFHTLSVKIPAALFGFSGTALLPCVCTAAQFHSISTAIYNNWVWSEAIRKRQKHLASGLSINEKHIPHFILVFHLF